MAVNEIQTKKFMSFISFMKENPSEFYKAVPKPDNLRVWYVKIFNLSEEYTGGEYILQIDFPKEYPFKPPDYKFLTPSGRFSLNTNLCFTNTGIHKECWTPAWGIDEMIIGLVSFFYERKSIGIGHIHNSTEDTRLRFAKLSVSYNQTHNSHILKLIDGSS